MQKARDDRGGEASTEGLTASRCAAANRRRRKANHAAPNDAAPPVPPQFAALARADATVQYVVRISSTGNSQSSWHDLRLPSPTTAVQGKDSRPHFGESRLTWPPKRMTPGVDGVEVAGILGVVGLCGPDRVVDVAGHAGLAEHLCPRALARAARLWYAKVGERRSTLGEHLAHGATVYCVHWPDLDEDISVEGILCRATFR